MIRKIIISVLLSLLLSACSTKLAYNYLDWILEWYVADLVNLTEDQEWQLNEVLTKELAWHRKQQLPLYLKSLDSLSHAINTELTTEVLQQLYDEQNTGWEQLKQHIAPTMAQLFKTMDDSQITQLLDNLEERNQELEEDYVNKPRAERIKQRTERMVDRIENWTGPLNESQSELIAEWSQTIKPLSSQWIANRRTWQAELGTTIRQYRHAPGFSARIENLFMIDHKFWTESYQSAYQFNLRLTMVMFVNLEKQLTDRQRQHLLDEIA
ncbi:DUF6279 family lipoprotein, partial [Kaarinaea lacus]